MDSGVLPHYLLKLMASIANFMNYEKYRGLTTSSDHRKRFLDSAINYQKSGAADSDMDTARFCIGYTKHQDNLSLQTHPLFWTGKIVMSENKLYKAKTTESIYLAKTYATEDECLSDLLLLKSFCRNEGLFYMIEIESEEPLDRFNQKEEKIV